MWHSTIVSSVIWHVILVIKMVLKSNLRHETGQDPTLLAQPHKHKPPRSVERADKVSSPHS